MAVGIAVTKAQVDEMAGTTARDVKQAFERVRTVKAWLDITPDADLTTLGYGAGDIANLRSAFADLEQLRTVFEGGAALVNAQDFRTFAQRLWGLGVPSTAS